jgi:GDP-4-dehydro-6-deoxy-D-mannose reductase
MAPAAAASSAPATILVTGANGFVGRHALPALRAAFPAARLVGGVQRAGADCPGADEAVVLNLLDPPGLEVAVASTRPDAVLHLAAQAAVPASFADPLATWRVNLMGTLALAEAVMRHAPHATFVQSSSAEVYGLSFRAGTALTEDAPFAPANPYAASKAAADIALGEMALRGLRVLRMRPFNQAGPSQTEAFVVPAFARQIARIEAGLQEPVIRAGALDRWRDMLDVRDVAAGYAAAIAEGDRIAPGTAINLASGHPRRVGDVLAELIARAGVAVRIVTDPGRLRPVDVERTQGDASRAAALLGWAPAIPWGRTLGDILDDWRARVRAPGG